MSEQLPGRVNWLVGSEPRSWKRGLPTYARVVQHNIYPGIDAEYYGRSGALEYDLVVGPGAEPSTIRLRYAGTRTIALDDHGGLVLTVRGMAVRQTRPIAYQRFGSRRQPVPTAYVINQDGTVGFKTGRYDMGRALVIDPVLTYSTYFGGSTFDSGEAIAADASGAAYVAGWTASADFPTQSGVSPDAPNDDAFIAKLAPAGNSLVYATYLGGSDGDRAYGLALLADGSALVAGETGSSDFPNTTSLKTCGTGIDQYTPWDGFVAKLAPDGSSLAYSTCVGGLDEDRVTSIVADAAGAAYIAGWTRSSDFPITATAAQQYLGGSGSADAFVSKINPDGRAYSYSTYLGGASADYANAVVLYAGSAYVAGSTTSDDFPLVGSSADRHPGSEDAFMTKVASDGSTFVLSTVLGGPGDDAARGIGTDSAGNVYLVGDTASTSFPVKRAIQPTNHGGRDGFITELGDGGATAVYSTYLGGSGDDVLYGVTVSPEGSPIAAGNTTSTNFPTENPLQAAHGGGGGDALVAALGRDGSALNYSTYLGGTGDDGALSVARDPMGAVYLTGWTWTGGFPTANAYDSSSNGADDAFVAKLTIEAETPAARFRPILRFDEGENWRPINLEAFFSELDPNTGQPFHRVCDTVSCVGVTDPGSLVSHNPGWLSVGHFGSGSDAGDYRSPYAACTSSGLRDCDSGSTAGLYYHETSGGYRYESYWVFYRFNDFGPDEHESDWEGLNVAIDPATPNTFLAAGFDQHGNIKWNLRNPFNLECDVGGSGSCGSVGDGREARRVWAYVASGSHASYPDPCVNSTTSICRSGAEYWGIRLVEADHGGQRPWGANMDAAALRAAPGSMSWADWPGRWGVNCAPDFNCTFPPPKSPGRQSRYCWGGYGFMPDPGGHACPSRSARKGSVAPAHCTDWFGTSIVALACSPSTLRNRLRTGTLTGSTPFRLRLVGRPTRVVGTRAIAQAFGPPLRKGQAVRLGGRLPHDTSLFVRAVSGSLMVEAKFAGRRFLGARGGRVVVQRVGQRPRLVWRYKDGVVAPVTTHVSRLQSPISTP